MADRHQQAEKEDDERLRLSSLATEALICTREMNELHEKLLMLIFGVVGHAHLLRGSFNTGRAVLANKEAVKNYCAIVEETLKRIDDRRDAMRDELPQK